ncbi:hypothetical protein PoB_003448200 [Plakobranchus ocellatus]|uniref:Reverse transcriptase domain-containing protein n=1 Tax=Plakobranchus ocellatus TaxID=259542 RepID=A0AAV4AM21_9GAST|nr:hypothetical protein PoB_003448200 [Plakobranchus ocellatus]
MRNLENRPRIKVGGQNINNLGYADDTVLIAENKEDLQKLLNIVEEESRKKGLELTSKKTDGMVISRKQESPKFQEIKKPCGVAVTPDGSILGTSSSQNTLHLLSSKGDWSKQLWSVPSDEDEDDELWNVSTDGRVCICFDDNEGDNCEDDDNENDNDDDDDDNGDAGHDDENDDSDDNDHGNDDEGHNDDDDDDDDNYNEDIDITVTAAGNDDIRKS